MKLNIFILTLLALTFVSCSPKSNPSKEYGEPQKVNLKDFEGKWEMISEDKLIEYKYIDIEINDSMFISYSKTKYTYLESPSYSQISFKYKIKEDRISNRHYKLIPFIFLYYIHIDERNEFSITDKGILVERDYEDKLAMILIIPAGRSFDNYYYYKRVE